jgi:P27 family predicted phage terminase small subunit
MPVIKSARTKKMEGNRARAGKASIRKNPIVYGHLEPPEHLSGEERRIWDETIRSLPENMATKADSVLMERYVVATARWREMHIEIGVLGNLLRSPRGFIKNPLLGSMRDLGTEMHRCQIELGLTPASRARLAAPEKAEESPMSLLMNALEAPEPGRSSKRGH